MNCLTNFKYVINVFSIYDPSLPFALVTLNPPANPFSSVTADSYGIYMQPAIKMRKCNATTMENNR